MDLYKVLVATPDVREGYNVIHEFGCSYKEQVVLELEEFMVMNARILSEQDHVRVQVFKAETRKNGQVVMAMVSEKMFFKTEVQSWVA